ncbi:MAG: rod shape-determining protein MreC [Acidimicrobiia bacterium]
MARPRGANRRRFVLALLVLTSLTLITLDSRSGRSGPLGTVGNVAHDIVSPIERATDAVAGPVGDWWSGVIDSGRLKRENRSLRAQVAELSGQQRQAQIDVNINQYYKHLLQLNGSLLGNASPVPARVVISDPGNFESTITLDRGQEAGIEKGMAVESYDGVVGDVIDSWHGGAEVRVLTDPESAIAVRTVEQPIAGIAQGQAGSHDLVVSDFDASARVHRGDLVVTADVANSDYPPDLQVGTVTSVEEQPAGLGLIVQVAPTVDFDALEFVEVLRWVPGEGPVRNTTTTSTTTSTTSSTTTTTPSSNSASTSSSTSSTTTTPTATSAPTAGTG